LIVIGSFGKAITFWSKKKADRTSNENLQKTTTVEVLVLTCSSNDHTDDGVQTAFSDALTRFYDSFFRVPFGSLCDRWCPASFALLMAARALARCCGGLAARFPGRPA
jgi:hypothetical protein